MSLYSGISFGQDAVLATAEGGTPVAATSGASSSTLTAGQPSAASAAAPAQATDEPKKNWSSALAFAPVRRPVANKLKPPRPSAALFFTQAPGVASGSKPTDAVRSAEPVLRSTPGTSATASPEAFAAPTPVASADQPTAAQATRVLPALTLADEPGGSHKRQAPSRATGEDSAAGKKRGRKKKARLEADKPSFNPDEPYDPAKPNDIEEYKAWKAEQKRLKERERRELREREARAYRSESESSDEGSYYSEDERDELVTGHKGGFAPPASYDGPSSSAPAAPTFVPPQPAAAVAQDLTGDEAYARRVALSTGRAPPPLAYVQPPSPPPPPPPSAAPPFFVAPNAHPPPPPSWSNQAESGWEMATSGWASAPAPSSSFVQRGPSFAPARPIDPRLASASSTLPSPTPNPPAQPTSFPIDPSRPPSMPTHPPAAAGWPADPRLAAVAVQPPPTYTAPNEKQAWYPPPPPPPTLNPSASSFVPSSFATQSYPGPPPPLPPPPPPPPQAAPPPSTADDFQRKLEENRAKAAAIAAKFAKPPSFGGVVPGTNRTLLESSHVGGGDDDHASREDDDPRDFATRMMEKWGHKEGQGLGVNAEGIVAPIEVVQTRTARPKGSDGAPLARAPAAMGKVVSETSQRQQAADRERFGESSCVITLEHMIGSPEEVDDELSEEIASECGKHGVVERVAIHHRSPPPPAPEDAVVIFVVFSGPAGAWTAIRALNDRFFGGRRVVARYFDERRFARGEREL